MTTAPRFRNVLLATDLSPESRVPFATALKVVLKTRGHLFVVHARSAGDRTDWRALPRVRDLLERWQVIRPGASLEEYKQLGVRVTVSDVDGPDPVDALAGALETPAPDLLVVGSRARDVFDRWVMRSVSEPLSRRLRVPTLFLPERAMPLVHPQSGQLSLGHVLIPIGERHTAQIAIEAAIRLAGDAGVDRAHGVLVHVDRAGTMPDLDVSAWPGWSWSTRQVRRSGVVDGILAAANDEDPDLIVMATRGRDGIADFIRGSTTERVLHQSRWPLLAVPC